MISFFVPGIPKPGGSKRAFFKAGMKRAIIVDDAGQPNKDWKASVKDFATKAYSGPPLEGPLALTITFCSLRPKGHFGSGKNAGKLKDSAPLYPAVKPDATKLVRSTEDALTGVLWRDDAQVVDQHARKRYADKCGAYITVVAMEGDPCCSAIATAPGAAPSASAPATKSGTGN